jgi:hypothetical protein
MKAQAWSTAEPVPWLPPPSCRRCGSVEHVVSDDGPAICRVCLFAWGHYSVLIQRGSVVHEVGGVQLRHAGHAVPVHGCLLCRADEIASAPTLDSWMRRRGG